MIKIKNRTYTITPSVAGMAGWLFMVTMVIGFFFAPIEDVHIQAKSLKDKVLSSILTLELSQEAMEAETGLAKRQGGKERALSGGLVLHAERLFDPIVFQAAHLHEVEPALVKAIIMAESGYNAKAISSKGARGLMQLMPETAEMLGVEDYYHPRDNIHAGVKYFKQLLDQFDGNVKLALAAYNAGSGKVREYQGVPPYKTTHEYIKKVFEYYHFYKGQMSST